MLAATLCRSERSAEYIRSLFVASLVTEFPFVSTSVPTAINDLIFIVFSVVSMISFGDHRIESEFPFRSTVAMFAGVMVYSQRLI